MEECIFCNIVAGKGEATFVYRDDLVCAFMDIQPVNLGHLLVIPNKHATFLTELPEETGMQMFQIAQRMAAALRSSGLRCEGVDFFLADGEPAGQEIMHVHLHVFPRYEGDGFGFTFPDRYFTRPPRSTLEKSAEAITKVLEG
jgi:histidine triad (HIT) family protein